MRTDADAVTDLIGASGRASQKTAGESDRLTRLAVVVTLGMLGVHLAIIGRLELSFDEAYYQLWSRHLAWGYLDHPPMVAAWIRLSTTVFGEGAFGVRALSTIMLAAGSVLIFATARLLFENRIIAALSVVFYSAMPLIEIGGLIVTPDAPLALFWALATFGLAKVWRNRDWRWWMLVGVSAGLSLQSKYTAFFLGAGLALAMAAVPSLRRWWRHPAPYVGGILALVVFAPVIGWNASHDWVSFAKQFGRTAPRELTWRFLGEFVGGQIGLMNPLVALAAATALWLVATRRSWDAEAVTDRSSFEARRLLFGIVAPLWVYFFWHALHDRVQANWPAPTYPMLAILAAHACARATAPDWPPPWGLAIARRLALPFGLGLTALAYVQALFAPLPELGRKDPTSLVAGWKQLAQDIDRVAQTEQASFILTSAYGLTSLLTVYGNGMRPIAQVNERVRWLFEPAPSLPHLTGPGLYVAEESKDIAAILRNRFGTVTEVARSDRRRNGERLDTFVLYRLERSTRPDVLDPVSTRSGGRG